MQIEHALQFTACMNASRAPLTFFTLSLPLLDSFIANVPSHAQYTYFFCCLAACAHAGSALAQRYREESGDYGKKEKNPSKKYYKVEDEEEGE